MSYFIELAGAPFPTPQWWSPESKVMVNDNIPSPAIVPSHVPDVALDNNNYAGFRLRFWIRQTNVYPSYFVLFGQQYGQEIYAAAIPEAFHTLMFSIGTSMHGAFFHGLQDVYAWTFFLQETRFPHYFLSYAMSTVMARSVIYPVSAMLPQTALRFNHDLGTGPCIVGVRYYIRTGSFFRLRGETNGTITQTTNRSYYNQWWFTHASVGPLDRCTYNIRNVSHNYYLCINPNSMQLETRYAAAAWERLVVYASSGERGRFEIATDPAYAGAPLRIYAPHNGTGISIRDVYGPDVVESTFEITPVGFGY